MSNWNSISNSEKWLRERENRVARKDKMHNQVKVKVKVIPETKVYKLTNPPKIVKKIVKSILQN